MPSSSRNKPDASSPNRHHRRSSQNQHQHHPQNHQHHNHKSHHHHNHHSGPEKKRRQEPEEYSQRRQPCRKNTDIDLIDLDSPITGRSPIKIAKTTNLGNIATFLRRRFSEDPKEIHRGDRFEFYGLPKQVRGNEVPEDASIIWYRVVSRGDNESGLGIKWHDTRQPGHLDQLQLDELSEEIKAGATLGELRYKIALALSSSLSLNEHRTKTIHPDQVVIEAVGGLRPGPIQGDRWICNNIKFWLCRNLRISLVKPRHYFVFRGFNERYVLHGHFINTKQDIHGHQLKLWLLHEVLTKVRSQPARLDGIEVSDIRLLYHGKTVKDTAHILPGQSLDFMLSRDAGAVFTRAQAWLIPLIKSTCAICTEEKLASEMPNGGKVTRHCAHEATACNECVGEWIKARMEVATWDRLTCPECPQKLSFEDVEVYATKEIFNRYDRLVTKAKLEAIPGFRWCLNPVCNAGQIYPAGCSKIKCYACKRSICGRHNIPWHDGETCEAYDARTRKQKKDYKLSESRVKKTTKPCPKCKKFVDKSEGCDHITCVCGHEWCWQCFATYYRNRNSFLLCKHTEQCLYRSTAPYWEGNATVRRFMEPGAIPLDDGDDDDAP